MRKVLMIIVVLLLLPVDILVGVIRSISNTVNFIVALTEEKTIVGAYSKVLNSQIKSLERKIKQAEALGE